MTERYKRIFFDEDVLPGDTFRLSNRKFHVGKADKLIKSSDHRIIQINLELISKWFDRIKINKEYALGLSEEDVNKPGIWIHDKKFKMLIDGWHRAYNLFNNEKKYMSVYVIDSPEEIKNITIEV
jgi:hypothetical protein